VVYEKGALRNYQKVIVLPSGEKRTALLSIQPLSIRNEECLLAISTDITQQKQAEEALQRSEERLRRGLDAARTGTWEWDIPTGEVTWNAGVPALFGLRPGEFGGTIDAFFNLVDAQDRERARREINDSLEDPKRDYCSEIRVRWPDGSVHWLEGRGEVLRDSTRKPKTMLGTVVDITDRKCTELALRGSEQSLREAQERELHSRQEFTRQLLEAQEQERQRLAAELHDSLGQTLSMIKNHTFLAQERPGLPAAVLEHLNTISRFADETIAEVRDLVRNLRPIQIEQLGLTDSIRELVDRIQQSSSLRLERRIENVDDVVHGESATHLYRIVQEALNNLIKHSAASRADFCLERDINCVRLRLSDDGAGFDVRQSSLHGGFGLRNIAERAQMLGGSLKIQSTPGTGTRLVVEVPIRDEGGFGALNPARRFD
jgi:PAS domain S-box-containing protein